MIYKRTKSVSALIATILLIVVAVALIAIILTWSKSFTTTNLNNTSDLLRAPTSDAQYYLTINDGLNGRFLAKYSPPSNYNQQNIRIVSYRLSDHNNIIDFNTPIDINAGSTQALDMGIVNTPFDIVLYLSDNTKITKQNLKTTNKSPKSTDCPTGYIPVPGNFLYGTVYGTKAGFCVSKYEMKIDETGDNLGDSNTSCQNTTYATWNNGASTCGYNFGTRHLVSSAQGYPLTSISQTTSIAACSSLGTNYHLITNNERMTISRNLEMVTSNWSSGTIGTGYIYSGHNDGTPYAALAADTNDNNGYYLTGQTSGNQRRTLYLTNGETIWDFSGNVREWGSNTYSSNDTPIYLNGDGDAVDVEYSQLYTDTNFEVIGYNNLFLLTSSDYNSGNGIGKFYSCGTNCYEEEWTSSLLFGGGWNNGTTAGILALDLAYDPTTTYSHFGLRCVVVP